MITIKNENVDPYDVDGTLVLHENPDTIPEEERAYIPDPVSNEKIVVRINRPMIRLLKESRARGSFVIVWSRGGYAWANNVIRALKLNNYVHLIISKPMAYFDDTEVQAWLPYRVFIGPEVNYKQTITKE